MTDQGTALSQEEIEFQEKRRKAWEEVRRFLNAEHTPEDFFGPGNPQHRLAPEFFQIYLQRRPSELAAKALETAFTMWGNLRGMSDQVQELLPQIPYDEDVWDKVEHDLKRVMDEDGRHEEVVALFEELVRKVQPLNSRSALLYSLARLWKGRDEIDRARTGFKQIIQWDASPQHVEQSRGQLYELDYLNIGQVAPLFDLYAVDGSLVHLSSYRGRVVLLHFWGTTCGWCQFLYSSFLTISKAYADTVALVGFSNDTDIEALRAKAAAESFTWPQICEGQGWKDTAFRLYNVGGIPREYVIDRDGRIVAKLGGGGQDAGPELEKAIEALVT